MLVSLAAGFCFGWIVGRRWHAGLAGAAGMAGILALMPQLLFKAQERTLELRPDAIRTTIGEKNKTLPWGDIASIERDRGYLVIAGRLANARSAATSGDAECY